MKRTLSLILVFAMLVCMIPAFSLVSAAADDVEYGLNADFYQLSGKGNQSDTYRNVIGTDTGEGAQADYNDTQRFDQSIERLLELSVVESTRQNVTSFPPVLPGWQTGEPLDRDGYMIKWTGTITAKESGTYTLVGRKVDNGFVAFVKQNGEMKKVYEYWAGRHWFDADGLTLPSNLGSFTLTANTPTEVEFWYLETNGGQVLELGVTSEGDDALKNLSDVFTFNFTETLYYTNLMSGDEGHDRIRDLLPNGVTADGADAVDDNGCQANMEGNHHYSESIDAIKKLMTKMGSATVPNYETASFAYGLPFGMTEEDFLIEYNGWVTSSKGGTYEFGTRVVDNCLFVEIIDPDTNQATTVYEFWARNVWNDNGTTYYGKTIELEKDKAYRIHAVFLEINGGQGVDTRYKVNGTETDLNGSGLVFTTEKPTSPVSANTVTYFERGAEWYYMTSGEENDAAPAEGWMTDAAVYGSWETANADLGENGSNVWDTDDAASRNQSIWAVKEFTVENVNAIADWAIMTEMFFDDNIHVYINGNPVFIHATWNDGYTTYKLAEEASSLLKTGKNTIAASLVQGHGGYAFDMSLYVTKADTSAYKQVVTGISTADQLLSYVASVNADPEAGKGQVVSINADIDMSGKTWTPINRFIGTIEGNGHTIKNLSYTASVDSSSGNQYVGMFVTDLANNNANGRIRNLTFENCSFTVKTSGANFVYAGMVAGSVDRANLTGVVVKNCTLESDGYAAAGLAARACWGISDGHILNCKVENSSIKAVDLAVGVVAFTEGSDEVVLTGNEIANSTLTAETTAPGVGEGNSAVNTEGLTVRTSLTLDAGKDWAAYYQYRVNAYDETLYDYRVVVVANTDWLKTNYTKGFEVSFAEGKSLTDTPAEAFKTVSATTDACVDLYEAVGETVVFGWVVTEVPGNDYTPTVTLGK